MEAVARAQRGRVLDRAARVASSIEEPALALQYIEVAFSQNPAWASAEIVKELCRNWVQVLHFIVGLSAEQEQNSAVATSGCCMKQKLKLRSEFELQNAIGAGPRKKPFCFGRSATTAG